MAPKIPPERTGLTDRRSDVTAVYLKPPWMTVGALNQDPAMKDQRYPTEDKIRMLREADSGRNIVEICQEKNIGQVTFPRWEKQFGQVDLSEAKRLKALERENSELKKRLAEPRSPSGCWSRG
jgi:putative transposase